nr:site-specific DNA-methyltransferase [Candidatus Sigynarchaeota archaeon]
MMASNSKLQTFEPVVFNKSSERMAELHDNSVDLVVTSPPYGQIKDYGTCDQIGFGAGFDEYFTRLGNVWAECHRVLAPQCRMAINVGDQYLRAKDYGRYRVLPIGATIIDQCTRIGFDYLGDIIWKKISTTNTTGGCSLMGSLFYPRNGLVTYDYEHILVFKKIQGKEKDISREIKELSKISMDEWKCWFTGHWTIPGIQQKEHVAMFPDELPYRLIRMFSFVGDMVLDPFAGSGTTLKVARALCRKSTGYEINPEYIKILENKVKEPFNSRNFFEIIKKIFQQTDDLVKLDAEFSTQKSITCIIHASSQKRVTVDLWKIPEGMTKDGVKALIDDKLGENNMQNFLSGSKSWNQVARHVAVIDTSGIEEPVLKSINEYLKEKCENKIVIVDYNSFPADAFKVSRLFDESQNDLFAKRRPGTKTTLDGFVPAKKQG